jgi:tRNA pseudouridine55 synthase
VDGFVCIDKPAGPSSFAVVRALRRSTAERKVGHAGTLDPAATGLLLVALGRATRLLPYLPTEPKEYDFAIRFGRQTDTLDDTGETVAETTTVPQRDALEGVLGSFTGPQQQVPPAFSAVKVDGVRAYRHARRGRPVEPHARDIEITQLRLRAFDREQAVAELTVVCSGGTYVRSLARDIARAAGSLGHASGIRRKAVGTFTLSRAIPADADAARVRESLVPIREAFREFLQCEVDADGVEALSTGREVELGSIQANGDPVLAFDGSGRLVALLRGVEARRYRPVRVFV